MAETRQRKKSPVGGWPKKGEIYLATLDGPLEGEGGTTQLALVVQNDTSNRHSAITMVAPITPTVRLPLSPVHVLLPAGEETGLSVTSVAVFNQIRAIERRRLVKRVGKAGYLAVRQIDEAIRVVFGLADAESEDAWPAPSITNAISASVKGFQTGRYEP